MAMGVVVGRAPGGRVRAWPLGGFGLSRRGRAAAATACVVGVALAAPEWVPHALTKEDGPVEYATFGGFLLASVLAFAVGWRRRSVNPHLLAALGLALVLFVAAGEEISWGQRLFGVETPAALVDGNRQDELNLHNIDGLQDKAVLAQLALAGASMLLPLAVGGRWARAGFPYFAGYLAYRAGRAVASLTDAGLADRQSEAAELLLALGPLAMLLALQREVTRRPI